MQDGSLPKWDDKKVSTKPSASGALPAWDDAVVKEVKKKEPTAPSPSISLSPDGKQPSQGDLSTNDPVFGIPPDFNFKKYPELDINSPSHFNFIDKDTGRQEGDYTIHKFDPVKFKSIVGAKPNINEVASAWSPEAAASIQRVTERKKVEAETLSRMPIMQPSTPASVPVPQLKPQGPRGQKKEETKFDVAKTEPVLGAVLDYVDRAMFGGKVTEAYDATIGGAINAVDKGIVNGVAGILETIGGANTLVTDALNEILPEVPTDVTLDPSAKKGMLSQDNVFKDAARYLRGHNENWDPLIAGSERLTKTVEGVSEIIPMLAAMEFVPDIKLANGIFNAKQAAIASKALPGMTGVEAVAVPKLATYIGTQSFFSTYAQARDAGIEPLEAISTAIPEAEKGVLTGSLFELFGHSASGMAQMIAKETGSTVKAAVTGNVMNALGFVLAGKAMTEVTPGGEYGSEQAISDAMLGVALGAKGLGDAIKGRAIQAYFETNHMRVKQLKNMFGDITPTKMQELRKRSEELVTEASTEADPVKKNQKLAAANVLNKTLDVVVVDKIVVEHGPALKEMIDATPEFDAQTKTYLKRRIDEGIAAEDPNYIDAKILTEEIAVAERKIKEIEENAAMSPFVKNAQTATYREQIKAKEKQITDLYLKEPTVKKVYQAGEAMEAAPKNKVEYRDALVDVVGYDPKVAEVHSELADMRANAWAKETGKKAEEWYGTAISKVRNEASYIKEMIASGKAKTEAEAIAILRDKGTATTMGQEKAGAIEFDAQNKAIITAFKGADTSTLAHEALGHTYFQQRLAEHGAGTNKYATNVLKTVLDDFNKTNNTKVSIKDIMPGGKSYVDLHEHFAVGFEKWLREGQKAKDPAKQAVFNDFKKWMLEIYAAIGGKTPTSKGMSDLYKQMLGVEPSAKAAKEILSEIKPEPILTENEKETLQAETGKEIIPEPSQIQEPTPEPKVEVKPVTDQTKKEVPNAAEKRKVRQSSEPEHKQAGPRGGAAKTSDSNRPVTSRSVKPEAKSEKEKIIDIENRREKAQISSKGISIEDLRRLGVPAEVFSEWEGLRTERMAYITKTGQIKTGAFDAKAKELESKIDEAWLPAIEKGVKYLNDKINAKFDAEISALKAQPAKGERKVIASVKGTDIKLDVPREVAGTLPHKNFGTKEKAEAYVKLATETYVRNNPDIKNPELYQTKLKDDKPIEVDGKMRPVLNSDGKIIANTKEGVENFWRWFEGSSVIDKSGNPIVVYHGTNKDFDVFKSGMFAKDPVYSESFATSEGGSIMPVYLNIKRIADGNKIWAEANNLGLEGDAAIDWVKANYDGLILTKKGFSDTHYIVFDPSNIKSATGNSGDFSKSSDNILWQTKVEIEKRAKEIKEEEKYRINTKAVGSELTSPHETYAKATDSKGFDTGKNVWVRSSKDANNSDRVLMVQISNSVINPVREGLIDKYLDKLYRMRPGYDRPQDFFEIPLWTAAGAHNLGNKGDFYAVRDIKEASEFIKKSGYKAVTMSALDVNAKFIMELAKANPDTKFLVGGYVKEGTFSKLKNVEWADSFDKISSVSGKPYEPGYSYKLFEATETMPRLKMSEGCRNKCAFCSIPKKVIETSKETIDQQVKDIVQLKAKLVYLDDKTFGEAKNHETLPELYRKIKEANPDFSGFVIQTTAPQMLKFTPEFLKESGIKYVELGIETFNDNILKALHKPTTEKISQKATDYLRENGIALIPNIIVGIRVKDANGKWIEESLSTYKKTLDYLKENKDIISHLNVYNLSLYEGTEINSDLNTQAAIDRNELITRKTFHERPRVHEKAFDMFTEFGSQQLDAKPAAGTTNHELYQAKKEADKKREREILPVDRPTNRIRLNGEKIIDLPQLEELLSFGDESWAYAGTIKKLKENIAEEMDYWKGDKVLEDQAKWLLDQIDKGNVKEEKSSFFEYQDEKVKKITKDFVSGDLGKEVDAADARLSFVKGEEKRAVDEWVGLSREEVLSGSSMSGIMSEKRMQGIYEKNPTAFERLMAPVKKYLTENYGNTITAFRAEDKRFFEREPRSLLSYTVNPVVAKEFYDKNTSVLIRENIPVEDIVWVTDRFNQMEIIAKSPYYNIPKELFQSKAEAAEKVAIAKTIPDRIGKLEEDFFGSKTPESKDIKAKPGLLQRVIKKTTGYNLGGLTRLQNASFGKLADKFGNTVAKQAAAGISSKEPVIRSMVRYADGLFANMAKSVDATTRADAFGGEQDTARENAKRIIHSMYEALMGDPNSLKRIDRVLDPEFYAKKDLGEYTKYLEDNMSKEAFRDLDQQEIKDMYDSLAQSAGWNDPAYKDIVEADLLPHELAVYKMTRELFDLIHDINYVLKLDKPTYDKFKGKYSARFYAKNETPSDVSSEVSNFTNKMELGMYKRRGIVDDWKMQHKLADPVYAAGKRLAQTLSNMAIYDYANWINQYTPEAVKPKTWAKAEDIGANKVKDGYRYMGNGYGSLSQKWVRADVAEAFTGTMFTNQMWDSFYGAFKEYSKLPPRLWLKKGVTVYRPDVNLGNFTGNILFANWLGINPARYLGNLSYAVNQEQQYGDIYRYLLKKGVLNPGGTLDDLKKTSTVIENIIYGKADPSVVSRFVGKVDESITNLYQNVDQWAKIAAFKSLVDMGIKPEVAVEKVANGFQNFRRIGRIYDMASKTPLAGPPFAKFAGDLLRISTSALKRNPLSMSAFLATLSAAGYYSSRWSGESDEDRRIRVGRKGTPKIPLPNFLGGAIPLSFKIGNKSLNAARFISPLYGYTQSEDNDYTGTLLRLAPMYVSFKDGKADWNKTMSADIFTAPIVNLLSDADWMGLPIHDPRVDKYHERSSLPVKDRFVNNVRFLMRGYIPGYGQMLDDLYEVSTTGMDRYGRKKTPGMVLARYLGWNTQIFDEEMYQKTVESTIRTEMRELSFTVADLRRIKKIHEGKVPGETMSDTEYMKRFNELTERQVKLIDSAKDKIEKNIKRVPKKRVSEIIDELNYQYELERMVGIQRESDATGIKSEATLSPTGEEGIGVKTEREIGIKK